jgi:UDP-N-acetylglucosamine acyltransferase
VVQDIPPYSTCDGHPARVYGLNLVGLRRNNIPQESIRKLDRAFKIIFNSGVTIKHALEKVDKDLASNKEVAYLLDFIRSSERGVAHSCRLD